MKDLVMYIVINKDLEMSTGKTAAQASHACTEYIVNTFKENSEEKKKLFDEWYYDCQKKIVLGAHYKDMQKLLKEHNVFPVYDLGLTEIEPNSLTAICLGIHDKSNVPNFIKRLRLL